MFQELTTYYNNQQLLKTRWKKLKNRYIATIYGGVLEHKTAKEIHKNLYDLTINPPKKLLAYAMKITNKAVKLDKGKGKYENLDVLAVALLNLFTKDAVNYKANIFINQEIKDDEVAEKEKLIKSIVSENYNTGRIWYVCSSHSDSAKDHKDYQGKLYVDARWQQFDKDGSMGAYITKHNIHTLQWVMGDPVWMITRPNCRHYFNSFYWSQIQKGNYTIPHRKIGDRRLQTPRHANLQYYQDRLTMLIALNNIRPTDLLRRQIKKTKMLIAKWKGLI